MAEQRRICIRLEDENWFRSARQEWSDLLARSSANPLFMSWDWQYRWWLAFGLPGDLILITARDATGRLHGLAPMLMRQSRARRLRRAAQLAPIGSVWRLGRGEVTEHLDWIVADDLAAHTMTAIGDQIEHNLAWDEILLAYASTDSYAVRALELIAAHQGCYVRRERPIVHYAIDTTESFDRFLATLGTNTRQRLFGRRTLLEQLGTVRLERADAQNFHVQLDKLDALSRKRWGQGLAPTSRSFLSDTVLAMLDDGRACLSTLEIDDRPISSQLDVEASGIIYNIRSAIDTEFHRRLSPGLLHLGYLIQSACKRPDICRYSLLAGGGKHSDYKREIASITGQFVSMQLVRRGHEKLLYRLWGSTAGRHDI